MVQYTLTTFYGNVLQSRCDASRKTNPQTWKRWREEIESGRRSQIETERVIEKDKCSHGGRTNDIYI